MPTEDSRETRAVREPGGSCITPYVEGLADELRAAGYAPLTVREHIRGIRHLGRWADAAGVTVEQFDQRVIARFEDHLPTCRCHGRNKGRFRTTKVAARSFIAHLRRRGVVAPGTESARRDASPLVAEFRTWMRAHRGVSPQTLDGYERALRPFFAKMGTDPNQYDVARVRAFVIEHTGHMSRGYAKWALNALRALLRFLAAEGRCPPDFEAAVPRVPEWRLSALPRYLEAEVVERVLHACDLTTALGLRDHAILLLLARLGLRAGDIVSMRLDDIDWMSGTVRVCGKGHREAVLPLPQEVGDALLAYLEQGRPRVVFDRVFLCAQAPYRPFATSASVSDIVRFALRRADVRNAPSRGAHLLRHSAATAMLRAGSTLEAIAAVLRHKSPQTTAHYAKVDIAMLLQVAQPWPAGAPC